ncbi:hypothetical protein RDABS01_001559 [Bienertia sinuspersici]
MEAGLVVVLVEGHVMGLLVSRVVVWC